MHLVWKLEAYDYSTNIIGTVECHADGTRIIDGTLDAFACCTPGLTELIGVLTKSDPLTKSDQKDRSPRLLFEAFACQFLEPRPDWDSLDEAIKDRWRAIAGAPSVACPHLN